MIIFHGVPMAPHYHHPKIWGAVTPKPRIDIYVQGETCVRSIHY